MEILRITARWTGFTGAPGYSVFHFSNDAGFWDGGLIGDANQEAVDAASSKVSTAFTMIRSQLPDIVTITQEPEAEIIDSDTGEILGSAETGGSSQQGSGSSGGYSAASGAVVNWRTNDYRFGRRIRGRTFIVPLDGGAYEDDGTLSSSARDSLVSFGNRLRESDGGPQLGVWSRPRNGAGGVFATVTASNVPDMAAVLRSRRD